jgi:hypothetical protein
VLESRKTLHRAVQAVVRTRNRIFPLGLLTALIVLSLVLGHSSTALAKNEVRIGVVGGDRTAYASTLTFRTATSEDGRQFQIGAATVFVDDASGTNAGWQVAISALESGSSPSYVLVATSPELSFLTDLSAPLHVAGQQIDARGGPFIPTVATAGDLHSPRTVLISEPGYGKGRYQQQITVIRALPADPAQRSSTMTLAVTITPRS